LSRDDDWRHEREKEEERAPEWSVDGTGRVCDALRTHGGDGPAICELIWFPLLREKLCLTLPYRFEMEAVTFDTWPHSVGVAALRDAEAAVDDSLRLTCPVLRGAEVCMEGECHVIA
jgi:hypothetical protein